MSYSLQDRKVLITGGSRGLGKAIAEKFAAEGAHLVINYASNRDVADNVADDLSKRFGITCVSFQAVCVMDSPSDVPSSIMPTD